MIEFTKAYKTTDGQAFYTLETAQHHELSNLIEGAFTQTNGDTYVPQNYSTETAAAILKHKERIIDILTTTPSSKPRGRKINGGTRKRTPKAETSKPIES